MKKNSTRIEPGTPDNPNIYDSPRLTLLGNATALVRNVSDLDGSDYFGYSRSEFEFEADDEDTETR